MADRRAGHNGWIRLLMAIVLMIAVIMAALILFFQFRTKRTEETFSRGQKMIQLQEKVTTQEDTKATENNSVKESIETDTRQEKETEASAQVTTQEIADQGESYLIKGNDKSSNPFERADKLAYTDQKKYTQEDLEQLDARGLRITRNEIYARHGRMFVDHELQNYFDRQEWYKATQAPDDFDENSLNDIEKANVKLIVEMELAY